MGGNALSGNVLGPGGGYTQGAAVYHNANQLIPHNVAVTLAFNSERYDTDGIHDTAVNNSRLTCRTAGKYLIGTLLRWEAKAAGGRCVYLVLNGAPRIGISEMQAVTYAGWNTSHCLFRVWDFAVGDYVQVVVYQDSGAGINILFVGGGEACSPEFMMQRIG